MRKALTAALAASLALAPITAAAAQADASPLSLSGARAGADLEQPNAMGGDTLIFVALGVVAIVLFFVLIDDDDDEEPSSP